MIKEGVIDLQCPRCGKRKRNMPRADYDPKGAVVAEILCPPCADASGALEPETFYFDDTGKQILLTPPKEE